MNRKSNIPNALKPPTAQTVAQTIDSQEIQHFSQFSKEWWDIHGPYAPLHKMTRPRMEYLAQAWQKFGDERNFSGLKILDVGCGGGLVSESLARLKADVTAIDADSNAIAVAKDHAKSQYLEIDYRAVALEDLIEEKPQFDLILALEIVEHVSNPGDFIGLCSSCLAPGGLLVLSTLNRTWKSFALGIVAAERVLSWAPAGTHDWKKFLKPSELAHILMNKDFELLDASGLTYHPLEGAFKLAQNDLDVNYFLTSRKKFPL
ncbi:MAG: bifunctional 2-polyprenyl-6-hydroxyphenol methylase/3-demethylubiquinol 3-O-methyltransferase UbiG [Alphaproteobacteria bacterium]|nr:bifunctional 2-polyprenyl-6-hydroxyphenol methylase/3-demethylubiquinol 3-O-methyltransferase UbiG [Alphaproteobacteria bacterium]